MRRKGVDRERAVGVGLYVLTLGADTAISGVARFALCYLGLVTSGVTLGVPDDAFMLALLGAASPVAYSVLGVGYPLGGKLWRWRVGAREPSSEERERIEEAAMALAAVSERSLPPFDCYVIDEVWPIALSRGRAVILSRGLVNSDRLAAKLAHEVGHVDSLDGRLTEGLHRMQLWDDPLREGSGAAESVGFDAALAGPGAFVFGVVRWLVRLAGGGDVRQLFNRAWGWYWRRREFAADAYAASLGQGQELLAYLEEVELPLDVPQKGLSRSEFDHPYVAERVDRLKALLEE